MEMLSRQGLRVSEEEIRSLESEYGLDLPLYAQYVKWMWKLLQGDLGRSFNFNQPVSELLAERLPLTLVISGKVLDLLKHLPIPIIVIGTASIIRIMRGTLLDELARQYVITARAKGVAENKLLFKYPVRIALNPIISTIGWVLPSIVSGTTITAIVLSLPTTGPLLFDALRSQDMHLAGSIVMVLVVLTVVGTFLSDILLVWIDPRIRYGPRSAA